MEVEDHKFDGRPQVDYLRKTETGELASWMFVAREPMQVIDGDGEIFTFEDGVYILVVEPPGVDRPMVGRALDRAELGLHNTYSMRPARTPTRTPFDIRTPMAGGRQDDDPPF